MKKWICAGLAVLMLTCAGCTGPNADPTQSVPTQSQEQSMSLENGILSAEAVPAYSGVYLEYGDREMVSEVCAMRFTNIGTQTISDAQLVFSDGTQELTFQFEILPAGQSVLVAELSQRTGAGAELQYVDGAIHFLEEGVLEDARRVEVILQADGQVQIRNITEEVLPLVRVFYRPTDENGEFLGGPCDSLLADGIEAGDTVVLDAPEWDGSCAVVTVLIINE